MVKTKGRSSDAKGQMLLFDQVPFTFGRGFLFDHVGHIISDARLAVVELIANSYDAGAWRLLL